MTLRSTILSAILLTPFTALLGCTESLPCTPEFGVYNVGAQPAPESADAEVCAEAPQPKCKLSGLQQDGEAFVLVHQLPRVKFGSTLRQVHSDEKLSVSIATPCGTTTREFEHDQDGYIEVAIASPPGGACAMTITASIANDTQACVANNDNACADLETRCEDTDSQTGTGGGTTGG